MTRERIITTLLYLASERGLANVSLSQLSAECSITKAALFHHFESRDALIAELFAYANSLAQKQMATIVFSGSAVDVLFAAMDHWHALYAKEPLRSFYRIVEAEALHRPEAMRIKHSLSQMIKAQSQAVLESLSSTGRLAIGDMALALLSFSTVAEHFQRRLLSEDEESIAWEEEEFITSFAALYDPALH